MNSCTAVGVAFRVPGNSRVAASLEILAALRRSSAANEAIRHGAVLPGLARHPGSKRLHSYVPVPVVVE